MRATRKEYESYLNDLGYMLDDDLLIIGGKKRQQALIDAEDE